MATEDFPRYARGPVEMVVDVEHERGIWMVEATFRHEEASHLAIECVGYARRGLFGRYRRQARVRLRSQARTSSGTAGPYRLERMRVHSGKHGVHDIDPPPRLGFFLEELPGRPDLSSHEKNVPQFLQGEEVSLRVKASHPDGVTVVGMRVSLASWKRGHNIYLRGEGDGNKECEVRLTGRIKDSQPIGRYRAEEMDVYAPDPLIRGSNSGRREEKLHPPVVFEVLKNESLPPPPAEEPKKPNWGFAGREDPADL